MLGKLKHGNLAINYMYFLWQLEKREFHIVVVFCFIVVVCLLVFSVWGKTCLRWNIDQLHEIIFQKQHTQKSAKLDITCECQYL